MAMRWNGYAAAHLKGDREIVLEAVQKCGWAMAYAAEHQRGDREIVLEAVRQDGRSLEWLCGTKYERRP
jgi:hypothetical protein